MPRQAIALLVHKDANQINELIKLLQKDFDLFIHIDKKSGLQPQNIDCKNTWKEYSVHWGGYDMVEATVFLYKKIIGTKIPYTHIILLSGDSLPVKSNEYIINHLSANAGVSFLENNPANELHLDRRRFIWYNGDFKIKARGINKLKHPFRIIRAFQKAFNLKRSTKGFERSGSQWTILSLAHAKHLLENCPFTEYKFMAVPDECFVQNHFTNFHLPYNDSLVYAHWPDKRQSSPGFIDDKTFQSLARSKYLFARKFEPGAERFMKQIMTAHLPSKY